MHSAMLSWSLACVLALLLQSVSSQQATPQAVSGCACITLFDPVCGTDRKNYGSACQAHCTGVAVAHSGFCTAQGTTTSPANPPTETPTGPTGANLPGSVPASSSSPSNAPFDCWCTEIDNPVCSNTGITYTNECLATCDGATVESEGVCGSDTAPPAPAEPTTGSSAPAADEPVSTDCICSAVNRPVCGIDGSTYSNACEADCRGVKGASQGPCQEGSNAAATPTRSGSGSSAASQAQGCACAAVYDPVCGTNGQDYPSACEADCAGIKVASKGMCTAEKSDAGKATTSTPPTSPPVSPPASPPFSTPNSSTGGSNNKGNASNAVATEGSVKAPAAAPAAAVTYGESQAATGPSKTATVGAAADGSTGGSCANKCPDTYNPVCGKDGATYANACEAQCTGKVSISYTGVCGSRSISNMAGPKSSAMGNAKGQSTMKWLLATYSFAAAAVMLLSV